MTGVHVEGLKEADAHLDKVAAAARTAAGKPVFVGTSLFYGRFQERGTRRGVRARRFLERAASTVRGSVKRLIASRLESGDVTGALLEVARKARMVAAGGAPTGRGKLRRSIKVQVGGTLRRS